MRLVQRTSGSSDAFSTRKVMSWRQRHGLELSCRLYIYVHCTCAIHERCGYPLYGDPRAPVQTACIRYARTKTSRARLLGTDSLEAATVDPTNQIMQAFKTCTSSGCCRWHLPSASYRPVVELVRAQYLVSTPVSPAFSSI